MEKSSLVQDTQKKIHVFSFIYLTNCPAEQLHVAKLRGNDANEVGVSY